MHGTHRSIFAIALLACSPLLMGGTDVRANFNARLLAAHNAERAAIGVPPLAWDNAARRRRQGLGRRACCERPFRTFVRRARQGAARRESLGGNAARLSRPKPWCGCGPRRKRTIGPASSRTTADRATSSSVGHYTQLIWRSSREVGCATAVGALRGIPRLPLQRRGQRLRREAGLIECGCEVGDQIVRILEADMQPDEVRRRRLRRRSGQGSTGNARLS